MFYLIPLLSFHDIHLIWRLHPHPDFEFLPDAFTMVCLLSDICVRVVMSPTRSVLVERENIDHGPWLFHCAPLLGFPYNK
jgi:hypothetical protein